MVAKARYRPRRQFKFLLYQDVDMELVLTDFIARLKSERKYVTVIRNGLRLMGSLMQNDLSVLDELFPWVRESILASAPKTPPAPPSNGNLEHIIQSTVQASVQQAFMNMPSLPATTPVAAPLKQSGTLGAGKVMALPTFDDDEDDTLVLKEAVGTSSFDNFMASMLKADEYAERKAAEKETAQGDAKQADAGRTQRKHSDNSKRISL